MPQILTELAIRAAKPPAKGTVTLWDASLRNFGCRLSQGGAKSFIVLVASGKRRTIGRYPAISLAAARTEAKRILAEKTLAGDSPPAISVEDALTVFLADAETRNKQRTVRDYTRLLRRHLATFLRRDVGDIGTRDVAHIIDKLQDTPSEAAHALVAIKVFFNWCVRRGYVISNPCVRLTAAKSPTRERVLTDPELARVYKTARAYPFPFGAIVRLLILTGQRRSEIGLLRWEWIDADSRTITLPPEVTKNNRTHTFPYGKMVAEVLAEIPQSSDDVFPAAREHVKGTPVRTINGWSNSKAAFDRLIRGEAEKSPVNPWTLHDLRRTFATNLAALGTPIHVTEKLLNHVSGQISGVAAIYNRHAYLDEMRQAIEAWEARLTMLLSRS